MRRSPRAAAIAPRAQATLALARETLKTLAAYEIWQVGGYPYYTSLQGWSARPDRATVYFSADFGSIPKGIETTIQVEVDLATRSTTATCRRYDIKECERRAPR